MTIGRYIRPSIVRWGVLVPGPVEFYIISHPKRTCPAGLGGPVSMRLRKIQFCEIKVDFAKSRESRLHP